MFLLGFLNSSVASSLLAALSPTIDYGEGSVAKLPVVERLLSGPTAALARRAVEISKQDWDTQETSLGFEVNDLVRLYVEKPDPLPSLVERWDAEARVATSNLVDVEEAINRAVADQTALLEEVSLRPDLGTVSLVQNEVFQFGRTRSPEQYRTLSNLRLAKDLVSYGVGCMFGRFSLDQKGLVLASLRDDREVTGAKEAHSSLTPDADNVIPIVDGDWFEDDITEGFRRFLRVAFGESNFEENLQFVTGALGVKDLREYFLKSFFEDHWKRYRKRPIYWLFASPTGAFNAIIYLHRYNPSTVSTVLNEYLREFQAKLRASLEHAERSNDAKEADRLRKILLELDAYEHDVLYPLASQNIAIDLDDGVKANYPKFGAALKKIPGLEASE